MDGSGEVHVRDVLPQGMSPHYPLENRGLRVHQRPAGAFGEEKIHFHCRESNHDNSVVQPIALSLYPPPTYFPTSPPVDRHFVHTYGGSNILWY